MSAPPKREKGSGVTSTQSPSYEPLHRNSATGAAPWKYHVRRVLGRFLVVSPLGMVREDCAAEASAQQLAAALNGRAGMEALA